MKKRINCRSRIVHLKKGCIFLLLNILYSNLVNLSLGRLWSIKNFFNKETGNRRNTRCNTLGEKYPYSEFYWCVFSRIRTEHGEIYRHFSRSDMYYQNVALWLLFCVCNIVYLCHLQMSITNPFLYSIKSELESKGKFNYFKDFHAIDPWFVTITKPLSNKIG